MTDPIALRIAAVFNATFASTHNTILELGGDEPLYLPASDHQSARIVSNQDFLASALHEAAHWCLASKDRRTQRDYGYWYRPPPRSAQVQTDFLQVEERNQALESLLAKAVGIEFRVSLDDFGHDRDVSVRFETRVEERARKLERDGLPMRAERFRRALTAEFCRD